MEEYKYRTHEELLPWAGLDEGELYKSKRGAWLVLPFCGGVKSNNS